MPRTGAKDAKCVNGTTSNSKKGSGEGRGGGQGIQWRVSKMYSLSASVSTIFCDSL